jgi:hypothetical protein
MTADQTPPPPFPDGKRKPPTIDLTATDVTETVVERETETGPVAEAAVAEPPPEPAPEIAAAAEPPKSEPQPEEAKSETKPETKSAAEPPPPPPPPRRRSAAGVIGGGIVGGAIAAGLLFAFNLFYPRDTETSALQARLAGIELELREMATRPRGAGGGDAGALDDVAARLGKVETALADIAQKLTKPAPLDPAVANRVSAIEGQVKAMTETVGILGRRNDEIAAIAGEARARADAASAAIAELTRKLAAQPAVSKADLDALTTRLNATAQDLAKLAARPPGDDRVSRLAIAAAVLRNTVERGEPYAAELAAVKALGADPAALASLEPFAATGLPSATVLAREISDLAPALLAASGATPREGGFLERLQSNAEKLVRIRRVEEVAGTDPTAIISRIEVKAAHADLAGALTELASLPPSARLPAEAWIKKAQARAAAIDAGRKLSADALAGLSK